MDKDNWEHLLQVTTVGNDQVRFRIIENINFVIKLVDRHTHSINRIKFTVRGTLLYKKRKWKAREEHRF